MGNAENFSNESSRKSALAPAWPPADPAVREALEGAWADGSWGRYHGPHCAELSGRLADMHGTEHVTLCSSGTVAVELALRGLKIGPGHEVILAGYDFAGNFRATEAVGAVPVLVDIDAGSWCLDAGRLQEALSPAVKAILVSHLHGGLADMPRIMEFAEAHGLKVVEDACQSPGAIIAGRVAGSWGDAGVLSFGGSKLLTAGRGGAVLTRDADIHQRIKVFAHRGNDAFPLSELQAAVLVPQLDRLAERNATRLDNVQRLLAALEPVGCLRPLKNQVRGAPSYYKVAWRYEVADESKGRERFLSAAQARGVAMDAGFRGFTRRTNRRCRLAGGLTASAAAAERTVLLHHPVLLESSQVVDQVADVIADAVGWLGSSKASPQ